MSRIGYHQGEESARNNVTMFLEELAAREPERAVFYWVQPEARKVWPQQPLAPLEHARLDRGLFAEQSQRAAAGLARLGITKGDRALLFIPMSPQLYVLMAAVQRIGAIPVFLDSWARRDHLGAAAETAAPRAMISFETAFQLCADVPQLAEIPIKISVGPTQHSYSASLDELLAEAPTQEVVPVAQEDTGLITFTTGSSGRPKGANRTHRFLAAQHYAISACLRYGPQDVDLPVFPVFTLNNIASGVPTVLPAIDVATPGEHDAVTLFAQMRACNVTCTTLNPFLIKRLADFCNEQGLDMPGLRRIATGGAPFSRDQAVEIKALAPNAEVWILYGSTEVEPMAHIEASEMIAFKSAASEDPELVDDGVNVGHLAQGLRHKILALHPEPIVVTSADDWEDLEVEPGAVGELLVAGEHVCRDYYNFPEAFERAKILDVDGTVWHRTGDMCRIDDRGYVWLVGRVHNAIRRDGAYCFPVRAEIILTRLPFARQAAYLGVPDATLGERTIAVIVPRDPSKLDTEGTAAAWRAEAERVMAKNGMPMDALVFRDAIPMDPRHHSKVEYTVLRDELTREQLV